MQKYELVFMLSSKVTDSERNDFLSKFKEDFKKSILQRRYWFKRNKLWHQIYQMKW